MGCRDADQMYMNTSASSLVLEASQVEHPPNTPSSATERLHFGNFEPARTIFFSLCNYLRGALVKGSKENLQWSPRPRMS